MNRKYFYRIIFVLVAFFVFAGATNVTTIKTEAASKYKVIKVKKKDIKKKGATKAIQDALDKAKKKGKASKLAKVIIPKGTYKLTGSLHIYSNTYLYMVGVTLKSVKNYNIITVGKKTDNYKGYKYKNIIIKGGTFNGNNKSSTLIKVCHTKNFKMVNCTVKNVKNAHLMEIAGVKDITIQNCTFKNQVITKKSTSALRYEAIQIDILVSAHFDGFRKQDLANKNITITGCTFSNVPRGVGSHTAIYNSSMDGITITNNTFINCSSAAVQGLDWTNCTITGNTITGTSRGICIYKMRSAGVYFGSTLAKQGKLTSKLSTSYIAPSEDQNIVISNNNITLSGTDTYADYDEVGIMLIGYTYTTATGPNNSTGDKIPAGDYYFSGVTVSKNTITGAGSGIILSNTRNITVTDNIISCADSSSTGNGDGIYIYGGSKVTLISGNTISDANDGIYVYSATVDEITNNTITNSVEDGISLDNSALAKKIKNNTVDVASGAGLKVVSSSNATYVYGNTFTNCTEYGLYLESQSGSLTYEENVISNCGETTAIYLEPTANSIISLENNKVDVTGIYCLYALGTFSLNLTNNTFTTDGESVTFFAGTVSITEINDETVEE